MSVFGSLCNRNMKADLTSFVGSERKTEGKNAHLEGSKEPRGSFGDMNPEFLLPDIDINIYYFLD